MRKLSGVFVGFVYVFLIGILTSMGVKAQSDSTRVSDSLSTQESIPKPEGKTFNRKWLVAPAVLVNTAGMVYLEYKWWWEKNYHPFNYQYEGFLNNYSFGVDKMGHFYISYLYFHSLENAMSWAGYSKRKSLYVAAIIPTVYALSVEIGDGFSSYNFSPDDLAANLMGIGYGILQVKKPFFQNINVKWSYFPSAYKTTANEKRSLTDDYDGHIYWMSFNVHNLLPSKAQAFWPKFLNLAVGYGVKNRNPGTNDPVARKFTFGLDYNLSSISFKGQGWKSVTRFLDLFHFPAPGIRKIQGEPMEVKAVILN